ncbi:hypothetical protein COCCADRAFT_83353 [Bipolaris zeicola 26-R-13]|uniref:Uncharacterized protein n=1 Tax=Cochliobolus carbonum (strain 26-R-13) TaxID=930089 RepID=W6YFR5_COCC2|nr:uncharacterized protein COCCADRAFT_83353 [Bipolaris zeicola 26-R-13]EUC38317.1 hypothetical protein COCCADRAFT_83353 [Bipolaris zeicola 26-R-13]
MPALVGRSSWRLGLTSRLPTSSALNGKNGCVREKKVAASLLDDHDSAMGGTGTSWMCAGSRVLKVAHVLDGLEEHVPRVGQKCLKESRKASRDYCTHQFGRMIRSKRGVPHVRFRYRSGR